MFAVGIPNAYLNDPSARKLVEFFDAKGLAAIKEEDRREQWYEDWISYQAEHRLYASVLSPKEFSSSSSQLDLLRLTRFLEVFAYCSPSHGYSLQVTFLGLFSILMGTNTALKREAVQAIEAGGLLAFGVSEKQHGSDLFGNEFTVRETDDGHFIANGTKYYIGNANAAAIISVLAQREGPAKGRDKRVPFVHIALRPDRSTGVQNVRKIRTFGVRAGYVGEFDVKDYVVAKEDVIAGGRKAWDAVFGTVTLGKFFLGFGSIGICEHALHEAMLHLRGRILYGKPVIEMPHIRWIATQAYARLTAMKLYAFRALDYVHTAHQRDRRYLLFNAVQKAKVSTDGVRVMALLSECVGAMGFEADTYFEMALRDTQLIPKLEGSAHINLGLTARFLPRYFSKPDPRLVDPKSLVGGEIESRENPYLMEARTGSINAIAFPDFLKAYQPLNSIANVRLFVNQIKAFRLFLIASRLKGNQGEDLAAAMALGQCLAIICYGQLIAENSMKLNVPIQIVNVIFHLLVEDLSAAALTLAGYAGVDAVRRLFIRRAIAVPRTPQSDWDFVSDFMQAGYPACSLATST